MTDRAFEPPSADPYDQIDPDKGGATFGEPPKKAADPYDAIDPDKGGALVGNESQSSTTGAFARGAERSLLPAIGSFPAIGAGAEAGGALGGAVAGPPGALVGGLVGGAAGALGASALIDKAQTWALHQLPDSWQDKLGLSDRQEQIDQGEHPTASFMGGLVPYALTMRPWATDAEKLAAKKLPENATALQRIMANPITARLFGGAAMGGMEIGQEKVEDQNISWPKAIIATGFGMIFNRPTRFGEAITEMGARPARTALGLPSPTLAQAADAKVMGPGVTEQVFQGSHEQDPSAAMTAQESARAEQSMIQTPPAPDIHETARRMHPELFAHYDDLLERQTALRGWVEEQGADNTPAAVAHLDDTERQIAEVSPEVSAAYRRAAEATEAPTVPAIAGEQRFPNFAAMLAAQGEEAAPAVPGAIPPRPIEEQRAAIRDDVARQMIAAGRPEAEAQAAGALVAARYEARAGRFNGALGTPEELYNREGAEIRGAKKPPPTAPAAATPAPTAVPPTSAAGSIAAERAEPEPALTATASRRGPSSRDPNTYSLLESLVANGGIRSDDPNIEDLRQIIGGKNKFIPGFGMLIRNPKELSTAAQAGGVKAPKFLDMARQSAVETGHLQDMGEVTRGVSQSTVSDLLTAIDKEARGEKVYAQGQGQTEREAEPEEIERDKADRAEFLTELREYAKDKYALTPKEEARAFQIRDQEHVHEVAEIVDRLALEAHDEAIDSGATNGEEPQGIPGWDTTHGGSAQGIRPVVPEVPGTEGAASGNAARTGGEGIGTEELAEYFQRRKRGNLIDEREAEGQQQIPGAQKISDAELAQRKANEPLKPKAEQKPADKGLFGDSKDQKELFQTKAATDTPEFKAWFGDSKVVDKEGNPQTVYHGTAKKFSSFSREATPGGVTWFTSNKSAIERGDVGAQGRGQIMELYASIKNPAGWAEYDKYGLDELVRAGYDGVILPEKNGEFDGFVFDPEQLKSVNNRGTFSPDTANIYHQQQLGKIRLGGERPIITLAANADASTFIHETGHQWLEELTRDANHPQAPDSVKEDAQTVRDWLGNTNEGLTTRQHEKFARGFEQYMREGVAPSPQLASVFGKFRDWLLKIYTTIRGLGTEITPQIRDVFDRMLATEPQRTVIAPERMERTNLADIHEADALHTEPSEAEPAMDRVLSEAEQFTHDLPGNLQNEHNAVIEKAAAEAGADAATETGTRPVEAGTVQPSGGGPEPVAGGGAGGAATGAELRGGGDTGAKGAGEPASGESAQRGLDEGLRDKPLAPRPAVQFGAAESPFVDKAGNIRLENLTNDVEVRQAIRDAANENDDFIGDTGGVVTDGQIMDLAADVGMVGAEKLVADRVRGQAFSAKQIIALRKLLIESATEVSAAMKKAAIGTDDDLLAYAMAKDRHRLIQGTVAQATAEAGRALRAFRNIAGSEGAQNVNEFLKDATGRTLFQLRQEAKLGATLDTPQKISKFMIDSEKHTFGRMVLEYWINGLISGPATHATYMVGNTILAAEKAGPETAAAAAIGALRRSLGRQGDTVRIGEVAEQFKAAARGVGPAVKAALDAFRTGTTTSLPGEGLGQNVLPFPGAELAQGAAMDEAAKLTDALGTATGMLRGAWDGIIAGGELVKAGGVADAPLVGLRYSHLGAIPDIELRGINALPLGTAARLPSRFIAAIHSFFRSVNYSMEKNRLAYRTAMNEGLSGEAFDARVGDLRQNPSDAMMEQSRGEATQLTLMGQGGEFTRALSRLTNTPIFGLPIFKFIDPFVHISSNIIEQAIIERTPVGIFSPEIRADLMGKNGNIAQDTAQARMLMGTVYSVALGGLAAEGYVSGSEPADPKQAAVWRLAGNQAHSVRIGDMWYDVHRLGPMGMLMGIASDMYDVSHVASTGDLLTAASHLQHAFTQNILDESFMRGPSDLIKAIDDPGRYGESYIRNFLSSFLPYSVGMAQMARASDPYSRQARSVMDAIKAKIPGMSESLLPRRDIWGEEMANKDALGAAGVTAIYETRMSRDPVNLALLDLGVFPAQVERKIRNVQLTDDQYDVYSRIAGRMTKMRLDAIVNSPDFRTWPNHIRHDVISEVITQSREAARGIMMAKVPQIARDATEAKLKKATGQ